MWSVTYCSHICNHIKFGELTSMAQWLIGCWSWYQGLYHISHRNWAHTCLHRPYNKPYIWYLQFRFLKWPEVLMFFTCCVIWGVIPLLQFTMMSRWDRDESSRFIEPARMLIISYRQWFFLAVLLWGTSCLAYTQVSSLTVKFGKWPDFQLDDLLQDTRSMLTMYHHWYHHESPLITIHHHYSPLIITIHHIHHH